MALSSAPARANSLLRAATPPNEAETLQAPLDQPVRVIVFFSQGSLRLLNFVECNCGFTCGADSIRFPMLATPLMNAGQLWTMSVESHDVCVVQHLCFSSARSGLHHAVQRNKRR